MPKFRLTAIPALLVLLFISAISNIYLVYQNYKNDIVVRVVDGDSFDLADGRRVRLLSLDAPEKDRCMHDQARDRLTQLIENKHVSLKDTVKDDYGRILANVFVPKGFSRFLHPRGVHSNSPGVSSDLFVNEVMIEEGLVRFTYVTNPHYEKLKSLYLSAKDQKIGIFSLTCRKDTPSNECDIKGNLRSGKKTYYLPDCRYYKDVIVDEAYGDRWFCSEEEAINDGFQKSAGCPF